MSPWVVVLAAGAVTYAMRSSLIVAAKDWTLPSPLQRCLRYASPAVFAAMVGQSLFADKSGWLLTHPDSKIFAALVAGVVAYKTKNVAVTLVVGMVALWLLRWLGLP